MNGQGFEEIEHTADVALHVWGEDLAALFTNAARGMAYLLVGSQPVDLEWTVERCFELEAYDVETLLVSWLEELLYLAEEKYLIFAAFDFDEIEARHLQATARGGSIDQIQLGIKAVTFSQMAIQRGESGLETDIVFDI